jgi:hypothetical protein
MKKFNAQVKIGTAVKIRGLDGWYSINSVNASRQWVTVHGLMGSFQKGSVEKFTNVAGRRSSLEIFKVIAKATEIGGTAQGHDLFQTSEALQNEDLHQTYDYTRAVSYLMKIRPTDAKNISDHSGISQGE